MRIPLIRPTMIEGKGIYVGVGIVTPDGQLTSVFIEPKSAIALEPTAKEFGIMDPSFDTISEIALLILSGVIKAPETTAEAVPDTPKKRWEADLSITDVDGRVSTLTTQIEEVDELHDIIEGGPEWGPGYTAMITLKYAA